MAFEDGPIPVAVFGGVCLCVVVALVVLGRRRRAMQARTTPKDTAPGLIVTVADIEHFFPPERLNAKCCDEEEGGESKDTTCIICLSDIDNDEVIRSLKCGHIFHAQCIDGWWTAGSKAACLQCPHCRQDQVTMEELEAKRCPV
mmetsp:Transcript_30395/g.65460  ORF Transcript_30395/g.65460 Transcript_30395/m.65460 type:complete len:144 (-) Transcript_30395:662-1093(-)|eukprot:CAMPEP_0206458832 /NCGR_PEP_ID=MMETSP0324_2-20121206/23809_1 /ASSEMBLY_ACC=CAM_ASM_000836 /TAXON_ID=2866 /ORGANISM="Crypthecodinium cohnii, Strain Seligo" /LENGTH=143 /DNA_ID=CAMNT_0053930255 /DNA_START=231 /DNA_END=662 /DNA_ORIENTATION=+